MMKIDVNITYGFSDKKMHGGIGAGAITGTCSSGKGLDCAKQQLDALGSVTRELLMAEVVRISSACCCMLRSL